MSQRYSIFLLLVFAVCLFGTAGATAKYSTVQITLDTKADYEKVRAFGFEHVIVRDGSAEAVVSQSDLLRLQATGLKYTVSIDDMTAFYQSRFDATRTMGGYRTLSEIGLVLDSISNAYPGIVTPKASMGNSLEGRPIWFVKISDNPSVNENEPEVYYYACHHAREVITPEVLIYFMRYLTSNYGTNPQVTYLVNNRELFFAPCLNPDGYYYNQETDPGGGGMWRKNRRNSGDGNFGVDINRNYGYQWGYDDIGSSPSTGSETYRGTAPFSEPEIAAQRTFINAHQFKVIVNYHSYAGLFLYPWGYDNIFAPDDDIFRQMGDTVNAMTGYEAGPPWQVLYSVNGGSFDWEYGEQISKPKIYAISVEVGDGADGFWPPTSRIAPLVQLHLQPNLFYARMAGNPEALRPPAMPTIYAIGNVDTTYFQLYWHHYDQANPALSFEVWQMSNLASITDNLEGTGPTWNSNGFTLTTSQAHSATHSYFGGNVSNLNTTLAMDQTFTVSLGDTLQFWTSYNHESGYDYGYVEASTNGGSTWSSIPGNITTTANPHGYNQGFGINGNSSGWVLAKFPLSLFAGSSILLRFHYTSDGGVNNGGWYIDDIYPVEYYTTMTKLSDTVEDTTLLVQNLQNGDYYYKLRAKDPQNQFSGFSPTEVAHVSFSTCSYSVGDADNSGNYDISDAVYLIEYIFSGGPAPSPNAVGSGDVDCSGGVDISDAVYLIAYIFGGGPAPAPTCNCQDY